MLRFSTFAVLVTVVGTFSLRKLVDIVDMNIGGKDEHAMGGYGAQTPEIFSKRHENRVKSPMCLSAPPSFY